MGLYPERGCLDPARVANWSVPARLEPPTKASRSRCPPTATPPSSAGCRRQAHRGGVGLHPQRGVWTQQGSKLVGTGAVECRTRPLRRAVRRRQHRIVGGFRRQLEHRSGVGLYPQRRCLDPARQQAGRHRRRWRRRARPLGRALRRRQHRYRGRAWTTRTLGAAWVFTRNGASGPNRGQAGWHRRCRTASKAAHSRCPPTATPPSWARLTTTK